ncbi:GP63-like [Trichomonas vaginalis G3]|uniref:GP63-like n=1 Tax=Trichomonas vaginalis (strain ATCC PRA-98 / G3) TaxID=412133 RepID=A2H1C7_TRIV3|nr:regulation of choline O-acetyltransferase protein [Trichomonas vaginalis G3]EAX76790.1 GP63-like [Trichomonas vaginalis G3]KAI5510681.1 regulation of choline O-acetyltransferase protein [Trichomonas vaginalis G3]|eukprot:XP_001289720.1 GP63-like [Trichomonas vaginalis G3]
MCHAFGITPSLYHVYHPRNDPKPHKNITCSFKKSGKTFTFLNTPQAHIFAVNHFGQEYFYGDNGEYCWSGIELEDGGGEETALAHPESRVYMSEMMVGVNIQTHNGPFNRLTDVSMSFLIDTGNYDVNWSMLQPIVWGNKDSIDGNPIENFATGAAQMSFPALYLYNNTYPQESGFSFKFYGNSDSINTVSCPNNNSYYNHYCNGKEFYNVLDSSKIGDDWSYDYIPFKYPSNVCKTGDAVLPGMLTCGNYSCNGFDSFSINAVSPDKYNKQYIINCTKDTIGKTFSKRVQNAWGSTTANIICPNPERFCRSVTLEEMHFTSNPFVEGAKLEIKVSSTPLQIVHNKTRLPPYIILTIGIVVFAVVAFTGVAIFDYFYLHSSEKKEDPEENDNEAIDI